MPLAADPNLAEPARPSPSPEATPAATDRAPADTLARSPDALTDAPIRRGATAADNAAEVEREAHVTAEVEREAHLAAEGEREAHVAAAEGHSAATTPRPPPAWRRALAWLPALLVTLFGLWLLWPVPLGHMPLSADHTVHLTRIWLYGQVLEAGQLRGWSPLWFFGAPVGELYPILGDLLCLALRALTFGNASWPACYAWMFTLVFVSQGWALLRAGRALGLGPLPGLIGALLVLADAGAYREGGWTYTVLYGVWPQALATSLMLVAVALGGEARLAFDPRVAQRKIALAALAGAAAILAHPMATPGLALAALVALPILGRPPHATPYLSQETPSPIPHESPAPGETASSPPPDSPSPFLSPKTPSPRPHGSRPPLPSPVATTSNRHDSPSTHLSPETPVLPAPPPAPAGPPPRARALAHALVDLTAIAALTLVLAAWWLWPMLAHRGWMTSYGWLHTSLAAMTSALERGLWAQHMPPAVGAAIALGVAFALLRGPLILRVIVAWSVGQWLLASRDAFWELRLDHLAAGFAHIQYQRFLAAAKPGLFLAAGAGAWALAALLATIHRSRLRAHLRWPLLVALGGAALLITVGVVQGSRAAMAPNHVAAPQLARFPDHPERDPDYQALLTWLAERRHELGPDLRVAFQAHRNAHWFMDSPLVTGAATYKIGFTPGDNFVHKPESGDAALLRRLGVRYLVSLGRPRPAPSPGLAASFGPFQVRELAAPEGLAHLEGPGEVEVLDADLTAGRARLRIRGAAPHTRLVLHVAGYPRWELHQAGALLPWVEVPAVPGPGAREATPGDRRRGRLRGGKADGDDGSEPTLIAAPVTDGEVELRYVRWRWFDVAGALASLTGLAALVALLRGRALPLPRLRRLGERLSPLLLALGTATVIALLALRWHRGGEREADLASAWLADGRARAEAIEAGPLKADMWIHPALLIRPRRQGPARLALDDVPAGERLRGFWALDDDDAKERRRGQHHLTIRARPRGADDRDLRPVLDLDLPHRPGIHDLDLPLGDLAGAPLDLRVEITTTGDAPPRLGLDLALGPRAGALTREAAP